MHRNVRDVRSGQDNNHALRYRSASTIGLKSPVDIHSTRRTRMRISTRRWAAVGTAALLTTTALTACSSGSGGGDSDDKTLTVWHYESDESAMGQAWDKAVEIFKTEHPGVAVKVENQTFEQIQKNAKIVLTGDDVPDVMEYNKGNATAGQLASQG